ncbi:MAG: hypothetical protein ACI84O_001660 [Myxococcota bacterium]|jgi:hypothetical protein
MSDVKKIAMGCLTATILIIAAVFLGVNWLSDNIAPTSIPQDIVERQEIMLDIDIPDDYKPSYAMYTATEKKDDVLLYTQFDNKHTLLSQLILHQQSHSFTKKEAENRLGNSFPGLETTRIAFPDAEQVSFEVDVDFQQQPLSVAFQSGRTTEESTSSHVYSAIFEYHDSHIIIMLTGNPQFLNRQQFERLLKSIK